MNPEYTDQLLAGEIITLNEVVTRESSGHLISSIDAILAKQRQTIEKLPNSESYANLALIFLYDKKILKVICNGKILRLVEIILGEHGILNACVGVVKYKNVPMPSDQFHKDVPLTAFGSI